MKTISLRVLALPIGLLALAVVISGCQTIRQATESQDQSNTNTTVQPTTIVGDNAIAVSSDGGIITDVQLVLLSKPGYVIIHADNGEGKPGAIIGSSQLLPAGQGNNLTAVSSELTKGQTYFAMLHFDDGDGSFDPSTDLPVTNDDGNIILMKYVIGGEAMIDDKEGEAMIDDKEGEAMIDDKEGEAMIDDKEGEAMIDDKEDGDNMVEGDEPAVEQSAVKVFNVSGSNFSLSENTITVNKGDTVKIVFTSTDGFHNWTVGKFNAATKSVTTGGSAEGRRSSRYI